MLYCSQIYGWPTCFENLDFFYGASSIFGAEILFGGYTFHCLLVELAKTIGLVIRALLSCGRLNWHAGSDFRVFWG